MPPITVVFVASGLAVWLNGAYFLGFGATPREGGKDPVVSVGWVTLLAGLVDLVQSASIIARNSDPTTVLAGIITFYGVFFVALGLTLILGLDLRPVGILSIAVAVVPLFWWHAFTGSWLLQSILVVWLVAFLAVTLTTFGKLPGKVLGIGLVITAIYTFLLPAALIALGIGLP